MKLESITILSCPRCIKSDSEYHGKSFEDGWREIEVGKR